MNLFLTFYMYVLADADFYFYMRHNYNKVSLYTYILLSPYVNTAEQE